MENEVVEINGRKYQKLIKISGRSTGMGAITRVKWLTIEKGDIFVEHTNISRSGNHWQEIVYATEDASGTIYVVDISNSQKNYSYKLVVKDGKIVKKEPWNPKIEKPSNAVYVTPPWM